MRPFIGVSCNPSFSDKNNQWKYRHYLQAVEIAGGIPVMISTIDTFTHMHSRLGGLLMPGGCDIHPARYGEEPHPLLEICNHQLDELELTLIQWALQQNIPVLGICRGMQMVNVALGGTLYQDLTDQYPGSLNHRVREEPRSHRVFVHAGSRMEQLLGAREFWVNSRHHQAIKVLGKGVCISGIAEDGVAELFEVSGYRLIIGAQCHPEEIHADNRACAHLFSALVEESARAVAGT